MNRDQITHVLLVEGLATIAPADPKAGFLAAMLQSFTAAFIAGYEQQVAA